MNDLQNKVITIASKEEKAGTFGAMMKIKDEQGLTYSVFKTKKDGTTSVAWENMPSVGDIVQVGYAEEDKEYEGKPYKQRTIRSFNADIGNGVANTQKQRSEPPVASQGTSSKQDETFWDKKAYKQCLWNYWLEIGRLDQLAPNHLTQEQMDIVWNAFNQIEKDADERFSTSSWDKLGAKLKAEAPKEEVAEDIQTMAQEMKDESVSGIPF